ncbi:MAG: hypothetical protein ACRCYQ_00505 [Nocardioides sp.]
MITVAVTTERGTVDVSVPASAIPREIAEEVGQRVGLADDLALCDVLGAALVVDLPIGDQVRSGALLQLLPEPFDRPPIRGDEVAELIAGHAALSRDQRARGLLVAASGVALVSVGAFSALGGMLLMPPGRPTIVACGAFGAASLVAAIGCAGSRAGMAVVFAAVAAASVAVAVYRWVGFTGWVPVAGLLVLAGAVIATERMLVELIPLALVLTATLGVAGLQRHTPGVELAPEQLAVLGLAGVALLTTAIPTLAGWGALTASDREVSDRLNAATRWLRSLVVAGLLGVAVCAPFAVRTGPGVALAVVSAVLVALAGRAHPDPWLLAIRLLGAGVVLSGLWWSVFARHPEVRGVMIGVALAATSGGVLVGEGRAEGALRAAVRGSEFVARIAVAPLAGWALGLFPLVARVAS